MNSTYHTLPRRGNIQHASLDGAIGLVGEARGPDEIPYSQRTQQQQRADEETTLGSFGQWLGFRWSSTGCAAAPRGCALGGNCGKPPPGLAPAGCWGSFPKLVSFPTLAGFLLAFIFPWRRSRSEFSRAANMALSQHHQLAGRIVHLLLCDRGIYAARQVGTCRGLPTNSLFKVSSLLALRNGKKGPDGFVSEAPTWLAANALRPLQLAAGRARASG